MTNDQGDLTDEGADAIDAALYYEFADGELSDGEQRDLLLRLELEPDGWRRLALAFVETQRWKRDLRAFAGAVAAAPSGYVAPASAVTGRSRRRFAMRVAGFVATLAVGVLAGLAVGRREVEPRRDADVAAVTSPSRSSQGPSKVPAEPAVSYQVARVGFTDPDSGEVQQVEAAVLGPPGSPVLRLTKPVSELPPGLRDLLARAAVEVVTTQRVCPVRLETGRQVMLVSDDGAEIRYLAPAGQVF